MGLKNSTKQSVLRLAGIRILNQPREVLETIVCAGYDGIEPRTLHESEYKDYLG